MSTVAIYAAVFAAVGALSFGTILAYRWLSIPLADRISVNFALSVRPTTIPVWVDPVGLVVGALFGLRPVPLVAAVGLWAGSIVGVALAAGLAWWWTDEGVSARMPPFSRLGYLVGYALLTTGPLYALVPWLRDLGTEVTETELALLIGVLIVATLLWIGAILVIALVSVGVGRDTSLWSMPLSRFEYAAIYAGAVVVALLVIALGSWSTPRLDQVSWTGIAGMFGIVAIVVVAGRLFVAPVTIIRDGRGPIEAIRWSNESIADRRLTGNTAVFVFVVAFLVRLNAYFVTVPSDPVAGLALATVVGTAAVGLIHASEMESVYRIVQEEPRYRPSLTDFGR
ncbi:hypothetical protein [Halapricum hydrolyticum]|uniref:Uncharacterized protein n=1 Tax=Halapricum hydrolyticum TaxID=2979991 RepID=A0AAE3IB01_9EURY|nr:hypothetical protein [Halapricum hydrolyticum]MCU4716582.1 hypothetical protein [Halapricum hydrolyticum]MCU4725813.1 hypothetical protein [Halapricum hydrolyticum]